MDIASAREALLAKQTETIESLRGLDRSFTDIVESARDSNLDDEHDIEGTTIAASRAMVSSLVAASQQQLTETNEALARVEAGTYGQCLRCGRPIEPGRLKARPATPWCMPCAQAATRR
jgi:DnaK suppressor protein